MTTKFDIIETRADLLADNDRAAALVREYVRNKGVFFVNLMGCPGSGKTTLLVRTVERLKDRYRIGVIEADADGDVDARTMSAAGVP